MNTTKLTLDLTAEVTNRWRGNDGYGQENSEWWSMSLKVLGWPEETDDLMARSGQELEVGKSYSLNGQFYIDPKKEWTRSYFLVEASKKIAGKPNKEELKPPSYNLVANVTKLESNTLWLFWTVWDDYENVSYGQSAQLHTRVAPPAGSENMVDKKAYFEGTMEGPNHDKDWFIIAAGIVE